MTAGIPFSLNGGRLSALFVTTNVNNVWTITKDSPYLDVAGLTAVALCDGWFLVWKQNSAVSAVLLSSGGTFALSGGNGTQWNFLGPML